MPQSILSLLLVGCAYIAMAAPGLAAEPLVGRIVYRALGPLQGDIFVMDADGRNHMHLVDAPRDASSPHWSPDGERVAVGHEIVNADGVGSTVVAPDHIIVGWSGDGEWLAVLGRPEGGEGPYAVGKLRPDGSDLTMLTQPEFGAVDSVAWSPGGSRLLVAAWRGDEGRGIHLINPRDGSVTRLVDGDVTPRGVAWAANGESVYYISGLATLGTLRRVDVADGAIHEVSADWRARNLLAMSPDGQHLLAIRALLAKDRPLLGAFDLDGRLVESIRNENGWPMSADWHMPGVLLDVSPAGNKTVPWASLRALAD
jgi:Tol biopolymer transport system component